MTFSLLMLIGPCFLSSLARSAAAQSPIPATISQLNKDDRTAFLFLQFFSILPDYSAIFIDTITVHLTSLPLILRIPTNKDHRTISNAFHDTLIEHLTSLPLFFRIPTKMYLFYYIFETFQDFLFLDDYLIKYIPFHHSFYVIFYLGLQTIHQTPKNNYRPPPPSI